MKYKKRNRRDKLRRFLFLLKHIFILRIVQLQCLAPRVVYPAAAPNSSSRFGPANEVKERLHWSALGCTRCARPASHRTWRFRRAALVGAEQGTFAFRIKTTSLPFSGSLSIYLGSDFSLSRYKPGHSNPSGWFEE